MSFIHSKTIPYCKKKYKFILTVLKDLDDFVIGNTKLIFKSSV